MISIAEGKGMTLETRCRGALVSLELLRTLIHDISSGALQVRQEFVRRGETILAKLDEPERKEGAKLLKMLCDVRAKAEECLCKKTWEGGVQITRRMYGSDATDVALKKLEAERVGN